MKFQLNVNKLLQPPFIIDAIIRRATITSFAHTHIFHQVRRCWSIIKVMDIDFFLKVPN